LPPTISYDNITVDLGGEFNATPTMEGGVPMTFVIEDAGGAENFVSIDANTGVLSVAKESVIGNYTVTVTATNSVGSSDAKAGIAITVPDDFDPRGMTLEWKFFMNQEENVTLVGLNGVPGMSISELTLPVGWPSASTPELELPSYFVFTELQKPILMQPGNVDCSIGNSLKFKVDADFNLTAICEDGNPTSIGTSMLSYKDEKFIYTLDLIFNDAGDQKIAYAIDGAKFANFSDPYSDSQNPREYNALQGTVNDFITPTDFTSAETMADIAKLAAPKVDVVLEVISE
jgi:hypothetical protein